MRDHLSESELLELHDRQVLSSRRADRERHAAECPRCGERLAMLAWVDVALADWHAPEPPSDGLARVMRRIGDRPPARARLAGLRPTLATLGGVLAGAALVAWTGSWVSASLIAPRLSWTAALEDLAGVWLAAAAFFAVGSLLTLAVAPILVLDAGRRGLAQAHGWHHAQPASPADERGGAR